MQHDPNGLRARPTHSGHRAVDIVDALGDGSLSADTLAENGLLDDGAILWFSAIAGYGLTRRSTPYAR